MKHTTYITNGILHTVFQICIPHFHFVLLSSYTICICHISILSHLHYVTFVFWLICILSYLQFFLICILSYLYFVIFAIVLKMLHVYIILVILNKV